MRIETFFGRISMPDPVGGVVKLNPNFRTTILGPSAAGATLEVPGTAYLTPGPQQFVVLNDTGGPISVPANVLGLDGTGTGGGGGTTLSVFRDGEESTIQADAQGDFPVGGSAADAVLTPANDALEVGLSEVPVVSDPIVGGDEIPDEGALELHLIDRADGSRAWFGKVRGGADAEAPDPTDCMRVTGGRLPLGATTGAHERLESLLHVWTSLEESPTGRERLGAAAFAIPFLDEDGHYIVGGDAAIAATCDRYSSAGWAAQLDAPVAHGSAAGFESSSAGYVHGGKQNSRALSSLIAQGPQGTWSTRAESPEDFQGHAGAREGFSQAGFSLVMGDSAATGAPSRVRRYDPLSDSWSTRPARPSGTIAGLSAASMVDSHGRNAVAAFGGRYPAGTDAARQTWILDEGPSPVWKQGPDRVEPMLEAAACGLQNQERVAVHGGGVEEPSWGAWTLNRLLGWKREPDGPTPRAGCQEQATGGAAG